MSDRPRMLIADLYEELTGRGFEHAARGPASIDMLDLRIWQEGAVWSVADMERGEVIDVHGRWTREEEACAAYLATVDARYWLVASLTDRIAILGLRYRLETAGISVTRNDCPDPGDPGGMLLRLFVPGSDYRAASRIVERKLRRNLHAPK